ncbi:MAG: agmatinase [Desulfovibrionaceae bacterium]|nr:agmatinase [Desulfovibrionaceae bacterium]
MTPAFLASEYAPSAPENALFHIIPAPLEYTRSYGAGAARGPAAILEASQQLETWDGYSCPGALGIHTAPAVDCSGGIETALKHIAHSTHEALAHNALPVLLGGEHSATLGALRALKERYEHFGIVHIDAHADLRPHYQGSLYSHASVMRRAVADLGLRLAQFGVRDLCLEEVQARRDFNVHFLDAPELTRTGLPAALLPKDFPETIYISFDVDGLDPACIPATGTPVPGGLGWYEAREIVARCVNRRRILGFDVVELAPLPGLHASDYAAARLVYHIMGLVERNAVLPR